MWRNQSNKFSGKTVQLKCIFIQYDKMFLRDFAYGKVKPLQLTESGYPEHSSIRNFFPVIFFYQKVINDKKTKHQRLRNKLHHVSFNKYSFRSSKVARAHWITHRTWNKEDSSFLPHTSPRPSCVSLSKMLCV